MASAEAAAAPQSSTQEYSPSQPVLSGVERDVRVLIGRVVALFDEMDGLRFQHFLDIWKDMKFALVRGNRMPCCSDRNLTKSIADLLWPPT